MYKKTRKRKWCDAFERTQHANEEDDEEEAEEEENWVKKFVKCFHHQRVWEWANELPSSSLFILIRAHIHKCTSGRYTWERNREKEKRESKDIQSSSVTTTRWGFSFSHHQRRRTEHKRKREKGDGSGSIKQNWSAATCKQKKRRENATNITTLYDDNLNETYIHAHIHTHTE